MQQTHEINGYKIIEKIHASDHAFIYRGVSPHTLPVILKMPSMDFPNEFQVNGFKRYFQICQNMKIEGVIRAFDLIQYKHRPVIILEDFCAPSLDSQLPLVSIGLDKILLLFIRVTHSLWQIHQKNIIALDSSRRSPQGLRNIP